ncbi:MAG: hypothetical protein IKL10_05645, partial [Clostridia bacterium]|nr:hypothetical protein [Clostridia bacterium]
MDKIKVTLKKSMSLLLTVVMLLSCWVWIAPEEHTHAHAASAFDYSADVIADFEKYVGAEEGSATIDSQYGKYFPDDSRGEADAADLYKNVAYSSDAFNAAGVTNYTLDDSGALESFNVYYPLTVLMYDGVTTPQFGISVRKDAKNNCQVLHWGTAISGTGLSFVNEFWRGESVGSANGKFLDSYYGGNELCGSTIADTNDKQYNYNGDKGEWYWLSNLVKYTGSMDDNTYLTTIYPSFKSHLSQGENCGSYKGDTVVDLGTASVPVHVINVKPWNDAVAAAISMYQTLSANESAYTAETITNFKNVVKNLLATNPQHSQLDETATIDTNISNIVNKYSDDAKTAVAAWKNFKAVKAYTVTWKNYDGTTLETDTRVGEGTTPTYNGATPSRATTEDYTYTFSGWTPAVSAVTGHVTYTAQFNEIPNKVTVTWKNYNGDLIRTDSINKGSSATAPAHPNNRPSDDTYHYTANGWDKAFTNVTENLTVTAQYTEVAHTWGEGVVTTPATCTKEGVRTYTCSCGREKTEVIGKSAHTPGAEATCTEPQKCTVCQAELAPAKGHIPGAAATCTEPQKCTVCQAELAPAKGHTPGAAATCTEPQKCTVCQAELAPAKGHTPGAAATCTEPQKCTVCQAELAPAKG